MHWTGYYQPKEPVLNTCDMIFFSAFGQLPGN